jgi:hypothetical protein
VARAASSIGGRTLDDLIDVTGLFARLVSIRFRPDSLDDAMERFRTVSGPLVRVQTGSLGIMGFANRVNCSVFALSIWQTQEALQNSNANPDVIQALADYSSWMAGPFVVESYRVVRGGIPAPGTATNCDVRMRIVSASISPERLNSAIAMVSDRLDEAFAMSRWCVGSLLLSPMVGNKVIAVEYWTNPAAAAASEARVQALDQKLRRSNLFQGPIQRELTDLFGVL